MLRHLAVQDLVIVEHLALELAPGMTALTGETGAGKSILIDALGLALGEKGDRSLIRAGCDKAEVTAEFDVEHSPEARNWLRERDLDAEEPSCILRRVLTQAGRSSAFINGRPATVQDLRDLGDLLIDIHGQHEHQRLLKRTMQREILDRFGSDPELLTQVHAAFLQWQASESRLRESREAGDDRLARLDFLRYQLEELGHFDLSPAAQVELGAEHRRLANASRLQQECGLALMLLRDGDSAAESMLARAGGHLRHLAELDPRLSELQATLEQGVLLISEVAGELGPYAESIEHDPARLEQIEQLLKSLHDLARKHRVQPEQLEELSRRLQSEYAALQQAEAGLEDLEQQVSRQRQRFLDVAARLSAQRRDAARRLSDEVSASMQGLAMQGGLLEVRLQQLPTEQASSAGLDQVEFLVSANPGIAPAPLEKTASGGELSRISLAIQVATSGQGSASSLIFDEVDVGIGGAVAEQVGQLLRQLASTRQRLCVTHLPQVAAQAHQQVQVRKHGGQGGMRTSLTPLAAGERVGEIARMLGGVEITERTMEHAREMLERATQAG